MYSLYLLFIKNYTFNKKINITDKKKKMII